MTSTRRDFLRTTSAAGLLAAAPLVHAAGNETTLRVALIGCGGRGTGAASQALRADPNVKLVAMADAFADRISQSLSTLQQTSDIAKKIDVPAERQFVGLDAYRKAIDLADVVLLTTPPHFRPIHLQAAVDAGKHVFAEKPVAVDGPGVRSVLAACEQARAKKLSVVSGLCLRYDRAFREAIQRIQGGAIGEPRLLQANDLRGERWTKSRPTGWTDMQYQVRNWYNFTWLSGDFNVEQHVHFLDVCAWALGDRYPVKAVGQGGRQVYTGPDSGNIFDHFAIMYEYADGTKLFSQCRQQPGCKNDLSVQILGSAGQASLSERKGGMTLRGTKGSWTFDDTPNEMYQVEHDELFASIRKGQPINNGDYMSKSTLLAIMGRMSAYTGRAVTWDEALNSKEHLAPAEYTWAAVPPPSPIAIPGKTVIR